MVAVGNVLSWWLAQMRDLVPARLRRPDLPADALIAELQPDGETIVWKQRRRGRETTLPDAASLPLQRRRGRPVLLRLPRRVVLERDLSLPLATEPELDRVVGYEVDRISPFAPADVAWSYAVERRDRAKGRLLVRVALLPRRPLAPVLARLRQQGVAPVSVLAPRGGAGLWSIGLVPAEPAARGGGAARVLAWCCAGLAAVAVGLPFLMQQRALQEQDARIARLRPAVAEAEALRRRVADRAGGSDAVSAEAARVGDVLDIIATLTSLLPDDTYLTSLGIRGRVVTIAGRSASAARLIPLLAADPAMGNAAFSAPVTRVNGTREDMFSIRAEFRS